MQLTRATVVLPDFGYRAVAPDGVVENEFCPVLVAGAAGEPDPDPAEVMECQWAEWTSVVELVRVAPWAISPWAALQVPALADLDPAPWTLLGGAPA